MPFAHERRFAQVPFSQMFCTSVILVHGRFAQVSFLNKCTSVVLHKCRFHTCAFWCRCSRLIKDPVLLQTSKSNVECSDVPQLSTENICYYGLLTYRVGR
eukprot:g36240.t1